MSELQERQLKIAFVGAQHAMKFDQKKSDHPNYHDLDNMPRVDFIVEMEEDVYFIELKDPGQPDPADVGNEKFLKKMKNGTLAASLIEKYLFTFVFRWAECCLEKSVHYVTLITLESPLLQSIIDELDRKFEPSKKSVRWQRDPLVSCQVHNMETWAAMFPDWPITRVSAAEDGDI